MALSTFYRTIWTLSFHLILEARESGINLAGFVKHISQRYGQYFNKAYHRSGTLWEGRFKASPISTDRYLLACSRYIEFNPVRAGEGKGARSCVLPVSLLTPPID